MNRQGNKKSSLFTTRLIAAAGYTHTFLSFSADFLHDLSDYLFRESELQQAALPQRRLEDLNQLHWFTGRQTGHQLQKLVHKTVLEVGQLCQEQPEGAENRTEESVFISVMKAANGNRSQQRHLECSGDFPSVPPKSIIVATLIERCFTNKLAL